MTDKKTALPDAIDTEGAATIHRVLNEAADPNAENGMALRFCARQNDYLTAVKLISLGADMGHALICNKRDIDAVPTEYHRGGTLYPGYHAPKSEEDAARLGILKTEERELALFRDTYTAATLPVQQQAALQRMEAKIDALQQALRELTQPKSLDKPAYRSAPTFPASAPKAP